MLPFSDSDINLWSAIRNDDEAAFTIFFNRYWELLYNTSYRYTKDHEVSEEIVHDIFLNIWSRRKGLVITSFQNFFLKAVRYQIYNRNNAAKLSIVAANESIFENYGWEINNGESRLRETELDKELHSYLTQLPERCQQIFQMSRIGNLSNQEISFKLGISKRSVENQIALALKHLRICFKHIASTVLLFILLK
jgi:RNA polymerase sigma-70 factor (family 1)